MPHCGQWRLVREIGHGAYGVVYLAVAPDGECAAVKVCRRDAVDPERYSRELRGAKLYRAIPPQEGLVRMRTLVETDWGFYAVMDLADDEFERTEGSLESYCPKTLASVIKGEKALPLKECVNLAISLSKGLAALQRHHLLHRDIKPANVLYVCGRPVLSDPGLLVEESDAVSLVGTPGYVPPEKFTDAASDVYSLGLTLKAASFGRQIEDLDKGPAMEADTGAKFFPAWWRILNKATDPTPSRRYQSAKALLKDLKSLRIKASIPSGHNLILAVMGGVLLAIVGLIVMFFFNAMSNFDTNIDNARRDAQWMGLYDLGLNPVDISIHTVSLEIDRVAATNEMAGAELRSLVAKMKNLDKKADSLSNEIKLLRDKAFQKRRKGSSDKKEFQDASKLDAERKKVREEIDAIYKELNSRLLIKK
jgi:serine/threonine protein kinase